MVNYKKFNVMEQERKRQAQAKEILEDFIKDNDIKKLVAEFFIKAYQAGYFGKHPQTDTLILDFQFGKFEYRLMRQPRGAGQMAQKKDSNYIVQSILQNSKKTQDRLDVLDKLQKRGF